MHRRVGETRSSHLGCDIAGRERVDADTIARVVRGQRPGEAGKARLGRDIARVSGKAAHRVDAGDVDDRAASRLLQQRIGGKYRRGDAAVVDRQWIAKSLEFALRRGSGKAVAR